MGYLRVLIMILAVPFALGEGLHFENSFKATKNQLDDKIYSNHRETIYCGCSYTSDEDSDGSGTISADECGIDATKWESRRDKIEWEHIVPASLMPIGEQLCWKDPGQFPQCTNDEGRVTKKGRECCGAVSEVAHQMINDMHNLAPSAAQLNQYRRDDYYGLIPVGSAYEDFGDQCNSKDSNEEKIFEPRDCVKGDVARVWFYMEARYGIEITAIQREMLTSWADSDPVSPWEAERNLLIQSVQGNKNQFVTSTWDLEGSCMVDR